MIRSKSFAISLFTVIMLVPFSTLLSQTKSTDSDKEKAPQKKEDLGKRVRMPVGIWSYLSQVSGGDRPLPPGVLEQIWIEITETSFFRCGDSGLRAEYKLVSYPNRSPMEFDLVFTHPITKKVSMNKGIYKVEGDCLTLCFDNTGESRPTEFKAPDGRPEIGVSVLTRKKKLD